MSERTPSAALSLVPGGAVFHPLAAERDEAAAAILAAATGAGTVEEGRRRLAAARTDDGSAVYGLTSGGDLVAVYILTKVHLAMELSAVAVAEGHRRRGHGRAALEDALRRSGNRPLVAETDDDGVGFYRACGFKLVGKRRGPGGVTRYRLGWHAPRHPAATGSAATGPATTSPTGSGSGEGGRR
ncbi:MAG: hypothetical protein AVDCRST_MAG49-419 [uncultured Thermomicrobiales bacterium]|uniref:N-acetyltransferase domain-containing protein n=1 Tax=uncultured Thermomicrobiales bacterium TaxID=1645740 RepID=A0A6J4U0X1_9BACT|nr:MAG: hypothetical protein AVDCRST_MAG49-419 [uncultured Thermomicrobiales bacterium]